MVACWVVTRIGGDKYPKPGESKIDTTGAGAIVRPRGRGGVLVVASGWWGQGAWRFPLGGGLGWW